MNPMRMEGWKDADEKKVDAICQLLEGILDLWGFGRVAFAQLHTHHPKFACFYNSNAKSIHLIHSIYKSPNIEAPFWCFFDKFYASPSSHPFDIFFKVTHCETSDPQTFVGLRRSFLQVSNEKRTPGWLGDIGDGNPTQVCRDCNGLFHKPLCQDPY